MIQFEDKPLKIPYLELLPSWVLNLPWVHGDWIGIGLSSVNMGVGASITLCRLRLWTRPADWGTWPDEANVVGLVANSVVIACVSFPQYFIQISQFSYKFHKFPYFLHFPQCSNNFHIILQLSHNPKNSQYSYNFHNILTFHNIHTIFANSYNVHILLQFSLIPTIFTIFLQFHKFLQFSPIRTIFTCSYSFHIFLQSSQYSYNFHNIPTIFTNFIKPSHMQFI